MLVRRQACLGNFLSVPERDLRRETEFRSPIVEFTCIERDACVDSRAVAKFFFDELFLSLPMSGRERVIMERLDDVKPTR